METPDNTRKNFKFPIMGMFTYRALFNDMPDLNTILNKLYQLSKFSVTTEIAKINDKYPYFSVDIIPHTKYNTIDVFINISFIPKEMQTNTFTQYKKDTIYISECVNNDGCEYYLFMVLCTILIDMGGEDINGRLLSETENIPIWSREKWQGEKWFKKVNKKPTLFDFLLKKIRLFLVVSGFST